MLKNLDKYDGIPLPSSSSPYIFVHLYLTPRYAWNEIRIIHRDHEKWLLDEIENLVCILRVRFYFETPI